jgi:hypothetical protein
MTDQTKTFLRVRWNFDWLFLAGVSGVVCEVGVGPADISMIQSFTIGCNCTGIIAVEPNPEYQVNLPAGTQLYKAAIASHYGKGRLFLQGGSSALEGTFMQPHGKFMDVELIPFSSVDPGNIDVLNIDCEGCEHCVLDQLRSRPRIIGIEIWPNDPFGIHNITWLESNNYRIVASSGPCGETQVWAKNHP